MNQDARSGLRGFRLRQLHLATLQCAALSIGLAACGGSNDGSNGLTAQDDAAAQAQEDEATSGAPDRAAIAAVIAVATPTGNEIWTNCAAENQACNISGTRMVRYGVSGRYSYRMAAGSTACTNTEFGGDPAFGFVKSCDYDSSSASAPAPAPAPASWSFIANENEAFSFSGTRSVRYGLNTSWVQRSVTDRGTCNSAFFGSDPLPNRVKRCEVGSTTAPTPGPPAPAPATSWTHCANEGGTCGVPSARLVRYGANGTYTPSRNVPVSIACNNSTWGSDPTPGVPKTCEYANTATAPAPAPAPPAPSPAPSPAPAPAPTVGSATLQWSASSDSRVVGYRVYWGTASRSYNQARGSGLAAGTATGYSIGNLPSGRTYYFAVTAFDNAGNESAYSAEATKAIP